MISHWAKPILALYFLTLLPTASALSAYLYGSDQDFTTDLGAPAVCNVTLNSPINDCGEAILTGPNERRFSVEELDEICTASCLTELQRYRTQILSDCDGWVIVDDTTTWAYSPSMAVDEAIYTRELACVRDNAGGYCRVIGDTTQAVLGSVGVSAFSSNRTVENLSANATTATSATANPSNSADVDINIRGIRNRRRKRAFGMHHTHAKHRRAQPEKRQEEEPDPSQGVELDFCHECVLKNLQVQVNSPFGYGSDIVSIFQSATSSCSSTQYPWTTPTSVALNGTIAVPTPAPCSGTTITLAGTETCQDISTTYNISTHDLLESNGLKGSCLDFPTEGTLCLPEGSSCGVHIVLETDTCEGISAAYGISFVKLLSWNPQINSFCSNLAQNVGFMICITNPRGTFVQATVTEKPPQITTASTAVPVPTDTAPQVNPQCGRYHFVVEGEYCALLMVKYSISLEDFLFLNPSVNGNCTDLWANASYCVLPVGQITTYSGHPLSPLPTPTGPAITTIDFDSIPTEIPDSEFTIPPRPMYTPLPLQNGTRQDCSNYRGSSNANTIITCDGIVDYYAVSMEDLLLWNPELEGKDPCVFENGKRYCARLIAWDESQTPDANARKPIPAPGPVQEGVVDPCMTWWQNMPGDTCDVLLAIANLSFDRFFLWNPAVLSDCSNLWTNTWYCIWGPDYNGEDQYPTPTTTDPTITDTPTSTGSPTPPAQTREGEVEGCTQWHVIGENDTCAAFLPTYSITIAQFYTWNPTANADCSGVWLGYAYCVAVGSTSSTPTITSTPTTTPSTPSPPAQTREGEVEGCTQWHVIAENETCAAFLPTYSITIAQFYAWNPTANADCSGVWLGYAYCVAVGSTSSAPTTTPTTTSAPASGTGAPAPTQPGINANCNRWYVAVENGPGCYDISANVGITLENFYLWNPALNGDCSGLWASYAYCTGVSA